MATEHTGRLACVLAFGTVDRGERAAGPSRREEG